MIVNGILVALVAIVVLVGGIVILDMRVILFCRVGLLVGCFAIWWFLKKT